MDGSERVLVLDPLLARHDLGAAVAPRVEQMEEYSATPRNLRHHHGATRGMPREDFLDLAVATNLAQAVDVRADLPNSNVLLLLTTEPQLIGKEDLGAGERRFGRLYLTRLLPQRRLRAGAPVDDEVVLLRAEQCRLRCQHHTTDHTVVEDSQGHLPLDLDLAAVDVEEADSTLDLVSPTPVTHAALHPAEVPCRLLSRQYPRLFACHHDAELRSRCRDAALAMLPRREEEDVVHAVPDDRRLPSVAPVSLQRRSLGLPDICGLHQRLEWPVSVAREDLDAVLHSVALGEECHVAPCRAA